MEKKPEWLKVRYNQDAVNEVAALMRDLKPELPVLQRHHRTPPAARPRGAHERGESR